MCIEPLRVHVDITIQTGKEVPGYLSHETTKSAGGSQAGPALCEAEVFCVYQNTQQGQEPGSELWWSKEAGEVRPGLLSMCAQDGELKAEHEKKGSGRLETLIEE